ncbi:MAG: hypothetical protein LW875_01435 [Proteobacteria bacterium]|jgi:hypothetical protein|nr:hypothetical protein [Pseudomonadota bacterium]
MNFHIEYLNEKALCSTRNPKLEAQKWIEQQVWGSQNCILGLGAGYHVLALLKEMGETKIFEPNHELIQRFIKRNPDFTGVILSEVSELISWAQEYPFVQIFRPAWNGREQDLKAAEIQALILSSQQAGIQAMMLGLPQTAQQLSQFDFDQWYFSIKNYRPNLSQKKTEEDGYWSLLREFVR